MKQPYNNLWEQLSNNLEEENSDSDMFPLMFCMAKRLTKNKEDAKELTQQVSETLLKKKPQNNIRATYGLIYSTVKNHFLNIKKANKRKIKYEGEYALAISENHDMDETLFGRKDLSFHQKMIFIHFKHQLTSKEYDFLMMIYSEIPLDEIAEELNVSVKRVRNRRSEIFKKLRNSNLLAYILLSFIDSIQNVLNLVR